MEKSDYVNGSFGANSSKKYVNLESSLNQAVRKF